MLREQGQRERSKRTKSPDRQESAGVILLRFEDTVVNGVKGSRSKRRELRKVLLNSELIKDQSREKIRHLGT